MPDTDPPPTDEASSSPEEDFTVEEREYLTALRNDLSVYDNVEVFYAKSPEFRPRFRIQSRHLASDPDILRVEIEAQNLFLALREAACENARRGEEIREGVPHDEASWDNERQNLLADPEYQKAEQDMFFFFARHFPQLVVLVYDMAVQSSIVYGARKSMTEAERNEVEERVQKTIDGLVRNLKSEVKRMVGTRSSGRPRKIEADSIPDDVIQVFEKAKELMGDKRGKDAVPGLKTIAAALGLSEAALGRRLTRCNYQWTTIRAYLESLT